MPLGFASTFNLADLSRTITYMYSLGSISDLLRFRKQEQIVLEIKISSNQAQPENGLAPFYVGTPNGITEHDQFLPW